MKGSCIHDAIFFGNERTNEQGDSRSRMFLILIHVTMMHICMMHLSMILDPDTYMYDAYINVSRSLTLMHVCMMHISMILNLDPEACMYVWCMYL